MDARGHAPTLGLVVVGCGFFGTRRALAANAASGTFLVGVADRDPDRAEALARRCRVRFASTWEEALDWPCVDAVVVATPHSEHVAQVRKALQAGKHVLCEKPLALESDEALELVELAKRRGRRLAVGFNHRFYPPIRDAIRMVRLGAVGSVQELRGEIGHWAGSEFLSGWHTDPALSGGGTWIDNGPHLCDLVRVVMGEPTAAQGGLDFDPESNPEIEAEALAQFQFARGTVAALRSSWRRRVGYLTLEIQGDSGRIVVETAPWTLTWRTDDGRSALVRRYLWDRLRERIFQAVHGCERSLVVELERFASACRSRWHVPTDEEAATGWDGYRAAVMIEAVYRSARLGEEVAISTVEEARTRA